MMQASKQFVWLDGKLVAAADARVGVFDAVFQHGFGLFETMRAYGGCVFRLGEHLLRLGRSAEAMGIRIGHRDEALAEGVAKVIEANRHPEARVRLTASRGDLAKLADGGELAATVVITAAPMTAYPAELYEKGMTVALADVRHNPTDPTLGHKVAGNYASRLMVLRAAQAKGCGEAVYFTLDRRLACGAISNVFLVRDGAVRTPALGLNILPGVTRAAVLAMCRYAEIPAAEAELSIDDLLDAEEVFLTNSIMEIMPVAAVEAKSIGAGRPGAVTRRLAALYREAVEAEKKRTRG